MPKPREKKQQPEENAKQLPAEHRSLQSYDDFVNLIEYTINGVFNKTVARQDAHTVAILTGYGIQALREARGGRMKMSVFLNDMQKVKVEALSQEEMDRFLQGDENTQMEVLQQLKGRGDIVEAEVKVIQKQEPKARLDTKMIGKMSGVEPDKVREALAGEAVEHSAKLTHEWTHSLGGNTRFCLNCGIEKSFLEPKDMQTACSGEWNLI